MAMDDLWLALRFTTRNDRKTCGKFGFNTEIQPENMAIFESTNLLGVLIKILKPGNQIVSNFLIMST